jgi:hypothetical protein
MLRIYTKLPLFLLSILSMFVNFGAQAEWTQLDCQEQCTLDICQKAHAKKIKCQQECHPLHLPIPCRDRQGVTQDEEKLEQEENTNDYQAVPSQSGLPSVTKYNQPSLNYSPTIINKEISQRAQALEGKILKEARIPEIPDMVSKGGLYMEGATPILTTYGILIVL